MLDEIGLNNSQEMAVLEFVCDVALMPYNRRTSKPLIYVAHLVKNIKCLKNPNFKFPLRNAFKWWWAFCKKHSIISLYYKEASQNANLPLFFEEEK